MSKVRLMLRNDKLKAAPPSVYLFDTVLQNSSQILHLKLAWGYLCGQCAAQQPAWLRFRILYLFYSRGTRNCVE